MNEELQNVIWNLRSILKQKKKFLKKLEDNMTSDDAVEFYQKTVKSNKYVLDQALISLKWQGQYLNKNQIIATGFHLKRSYILKIKIEIDALKKSNY